MSKEALISLIDNVDEKEFDLLYQVILKFVKEVPAYEDEIQAIAQAETEYLNGEVYSHDEVWG
ncbi:MAG: hypothetical protein IJH37_04200 [Clostridia bacterium]|nr:hypothetical protein [Clostridia bacterium]